MPVETVEEVISFTVPISRRLTRKTSTPLDTELAARACENPELMPQPTAPGNGTRTASAGPGFEVGDHVIVTRRMSPSVSLPGQPDFRRDLTVGATAIIETLEDAEHPGKVEIKATIMHRAVAHEIKTWVLRQNLARPWQFEGAPIDF